MKTKIIEVTNGPKNWGKFCLGRFDVEWERGSTPCPPKMSDEALSRIGYDSSLLSQIGWTDKHLLVLDLQTGEGAIFYAQPHGYPKADLDKHQIWVCPMFEPFLGWLYKQNLTDLAALPYHVDLPDAEFQMSGYRRTGI